MSESDEEQEYYAHLRSATSADRSRARPSPLALQHWAPAPIVGTWPCRVKSCRAPVPIPDTADGLLADMNRALAAMNKRDGTNLPPIDYTAVMFCDVHRAQLAVESQRRNAVAREKIAADIRALKESIRPDDAEREVFLRLEALGHPDVDGLRIWLRESRKKSKGRGM